MVRVRNLLTLIATVAFISGCVSSHKIDQSVPQQAPHKWRAKGKLGVVTPQRSGAVNFDWEHSNEDFEIRLYGVLGIGNARLTRNTQGVQLITKGQVIHATSSEDLMVKTLGWSLPVTELVHWIKGMPSPTSVVENKEIDNAGKIRYLEQQGWQISYTSYHGNRANTMPRKIIAQREGLRLTIAIKSWHY